MLSSNCIRSVHLGLDTGGGEEPNLVVEIDELVSVSAKSASSKQVPAPSRNRLALNVGNHPRTGAHLEWAATLTELMEVPLYPADERRNIFTEQLGSPGAPHRRPLRQIGNATRGERT